MSKRFNKRKKDDARQEHKLAKKEARRMFMKSFMPLMIAVILWIGTLTILHLPAIKNEVAYFFINLTLDSSLFFGKMLFIPVESYTYPNITVSDYPMTVVMECTAYNFYVFVIYLSLLSPVSWKQRLYTLLIFLGAVFVVNNMRFITMGYIGKYSTVLFHYVHDYLWNILFGFMVFLIWAWRYKNTMDVGGKKEE